MKVILSRKGFDSKYGGCSSPILPNGRMISLPIPADLKNFEEIKYSDLKVDENLTYYHLMKQLKLNIKNSNGGDILTEDMQCHFDPDINECVMKRKPRWKPIFGQIGAAQTHLKNKGIKKDDIFLFFGTFRKTTINQNGMYQFEGPAFHAIYGYLQIGKRIPLDKNTKFPEWMVYHPHTHPTKGVGGNNTIYVAGDQLTWQPDMPGAGVLSFTEKLILTKKGYPKSRWDLPPFFKEVKISYHSKKSWNEKDSYFQSARIGQEFVIGAEDNKEIENWVKDKLRKN